MADRERGTAPDPDVAVVDIWAFTVDPTVAASDVVGFAVEATDGGIGKIDAATHEAGRGHVVVDTGPWIFGKKVVLPAGVIDHVDLDAQTVYVNRSRDQIKDSPPYLPERGIDDDYRERLGTYYR